MNDRFIAATLTGSHPRASSMNVVMQQVAGQLLVVEDDEDSRNVLSRILTRDGFTVSAAADGRLALDAIARQPFDLVLLDVEMPGMNGFDVLQRVRETHAATKLPVIMTTARGDRKDVVQALGLGANDFVTKPLDFKVVIARVRTQLSLKWAVDRIVALESDLRHRNELLEETNARMRRSLELAGHMQQSLLPVSPLRLAGTEFAWAYQPCDELGGDILNVFPLVGGQIGFYLLDVSGHGVPAALLSVTLSRMLAPVPGKPSLVEKRGEHGLEPRSPREVVEELNRRFQMSGENLQYFTLFYGIFDPATLRLRYVSAGNPPILYMPASGPPRFLVDTGFAVGWFADAELDEHVLDLNSSDRLYIYSDGCTETVNGDREEFGRQRLLSACGAAGEISIAHSLAHLIEQIACFRGAAAIADDISALALQIFTL